MEHIEIKAWAAIVLVAVLLGAACFLLLGKAEAKTPDGTLVEAVFYEEPPAALAWREAA